MCGEGGGGGGVEVCVCIGVGREGGGGERGAVQGAESIITVFGAVCVSLTLAWSSIEGGGVTTEAAESHANHVFWPGIISTMFTLTSLLQF